MDYGKLNMFYIPCESYKFYGGRVQWPNRLPSKGYGYGNVLNVAKIWKVMDSRGITANRAATFFNMSWHSN
jgi:hypothetical protein